MEIQCKHGKGVAAIVCVHHIKNEEPQGFIENSSTPSDYQGWCFKCEDKFLLEGEINDNFRSFNNAQVVCEECYFQIKARHFKN